MKNEFKKKGADGKELPEKIGQGLTEHCLKVLKEREYLKETISFRVSINQRIEFESFCAENKLDTTLVLRQLYNNVQTDWSIKVDFLIQELSILGDLNRQQEQTIKDTIQALKDNGRKDDALLITSLETTLKK